MGNNSDQPYKLWTPPLYEQEEHTATVSNFLSAYLNFTPSLIFFSFEETYSLSLVIPLDVNAN
jgi:hypothetical protein